MESAVGDRLLEFLSVQRVLRSPNLSVGVGVLPVEEAGLVLPKKLVEECILADMDLSQVSMYGHSMSPTFALASIRNRTSSAKPRSQGMEGNVELVPEKRRFLKMS